MVVAAPTIQLISGAWDSTFADVVSSAQQRLVLCAPYVSQQGAEAVARARIGRTEIGKQSLLLTDLSPFAVCAGATDPRAVASVGTALNGGKVVHLPRLHAKVYVADGRKAVVTSGNLTSGGLGRNYEYGVLVSDKVLATAIEADVLEYASLGAEMDEAALARYCDAAMEVQSACQQQVASASRAATRKLALALREAEDALMSVRIAGGARHTVFANTIVFLLRRHGPLKTTQLHPLVKELHPDLCDDNVDRVIKGKNFSQKWWHAVRTSQQHLKKAGTIVRVDDRWCLVGA